MLPPRLFVILIGLTALLTLPLDYPHPRPQAVQVAFNPPTDSSAQTFLDSPLSLDDQSKIQSLTASEWLGPMAPVAISPFFGITCLAGLSQFGGDYLPANNFISNNAVLNHPAVFWIFLILTLLTSLPRLTKVSKPFAQSMDMLETYGGIITIVVLRFASSIPVEEPATTVAIASPVFQMGGLSLPVDVLFSIAAIVNIIVINTVKFFFEVLVWLIPFPFVDAALEVANKSICGVLVAIYAYSPVLGLGINVVLFLACLFVFNWIRRRVTFYRTMLTDLLLSYLWPSFGNWRGDQLVGFVNERFESIPAKSRIVIQRTEQGWQVIEKRLLMPQRVIQLAAADHRFEFRRGFLSSSIQSSSAERPIEIVITNRYANQVQDIVDHFGFQRMDDISGSTLAANSPGL